MPTCAKMWNWARGLKARDKALDEMNAVASRRLIERMAQNPEQLRGYLNLMFIARHLERVGDHATNIAEDAVYAAAAEDIRHQAAATAGAAVACDSISCATESGLAGLEEAGRRTPANESWAQGNARSGRISRRAQSAGRILSSRVRCRAPTQTADIAAEHLKVRVREEKLLAPDFPLEDLTRLLRKYPQQVPDAGGSRAGFLAASSRP